MNLFEPRQRLTLKAATISALDTKNAPTSNAGASSGHNLVIIGEISPYPAILDTLLLPEINLYSRSLPFHKYEVLVVRRLSPERPVLDR